MRIFVAGHRGLVGSALVRRLAAEGISEVITRTRSELDLTNQNAVVEFFATAKIDQVYLAAAKVGGIHANDSYPADFIRDNLQMQTNVIDAAYRHGVKKLLFLGSSCIYPKHAPQPMNEDCLLTGPLEPTNQWYAIAKIAGLKMCQAYRRQYGFNAISVMPTNLYGPGDNYHPVHSHVPAALIRRFHEAKTAGAPTVTVWGTGHQRREFLYVDDLADACVFLLKHYSSGQFINVGTGQDITVAEFAGQVGGVVAYQGEIVFDPERPEGVPRKLLDVSRLSKLGWQARTTLQVGLRAAYDDFLRNDRRHS
jgi:GDP-L-fucose synthase